ncbi:hypothetical protein MUO83_07220 [Candidatus Bathyarchaeota archaeon]|jgi:hypothetical protein|nr:hypothetical protein [Candidatus Bathyarchaeota archaeon]
MRPQGWSRYEKGLWDARSIGLKTEKEGVVREISPLRVGSNPSGPIGSLDVKKKVSILMNFNYI